VKHAAAILFLLLSLLSGGTAEAQQRRSTQQQTPLTAIVFLAVDCPISQKYTGELVQIDSIFDAMVNVQGILPGNVKQEEVDQFKAEYNITFPLIVDRDFLWVKKYSATTTPEVFLVDRQGSLHYQGAIDNWFFDLGKYRQQITEHYLIDAIRAVLEGREPIISRTESVGCVIQQPSSKKIN